MVEPFILSRSQGSNFFNNRNFTGSWGTHICHSFKIRQNLSWHKNNTKGAAIQQSNHSSMLKSANFIQLAFSPLWILWNVTLYNSKITPYFGSKSLHCFLRQRPPTWRQGRLSNCVSTFVFTSLLLNVARLGPLTWMCEGWSLVSK